MSRAKFIATLGFLSKISGEKKKIVDADVLKLTPTQMFVFVVVSLKFRLDINRLFLFSFHEGSIQS